MRTVYDDTRVHCIYRLWTNEGELLYIGLSCSMHYRIESHRLSTSWFREVAVITIEHLPTRYEARLAEKEAIKRENPRHNIIANNNRGNGTRTEKREGLEDIARRESAEDRIAKLERQVARLVKKLNKKEEE